MHDARVAPRHKCDARDGCGRARRVLVHVPHLALARHALDGSGVHDRGPDGHARLASRDGDGALLVAHIPLRVRLRMLLVLRGAGLWDAIWGYIALNDDKNTIKGAVFDHKAETPGLGANIKQRFFMDDFIGESLLDIQGNFKGVTVSKTNLDPKNEDKYDNEVDAIAGSTITGDGVTAMIRSDLSLYQPYFNSLNN